MNDVATGAIELQTAPSKIKRGQFFPLDVNAVREIPLLGGQAEEVGAYIVLAAHTQGQEKYRHRLTSAGVKAVYTYTGMPIRRAQKAVKTLAQLGFISPADEARRELGEEMVPQHFGKSKIKPRFVVHGEQDNVEKAVNLPHALIRGAPALTPALDLLRQSLQQPPPLARLYQQIDGDPCEGVSMPEARLDALVLLAYLYQNHRLEECGGVDPRAGLYRRWAIAENADQTLAELNIAPVEPLPGTNAAVFEVRPGGTLVYKPFAHRALAFAPEETRTARFWCALRNLQELGFLYETVSVWSADPIINESAEPLYTLYISDAHARQNGEPYLQKVIHSVCERILGFDAWRLWTDEFPTPGLIDACASIGGGFRFIGAKTRPSHPIGIFRLRFRPHDRETGLGIEREERRVNEWGKMLRKLTR